MLHSLHVVNLALVEDVRIEFATGLNVITGETGAGKSILIGALGLALGERADKSAIRSGQDQGSVEAIFQLDDSAAIDGLLEGFGLAACEDGLLIVRRALSAAGASRAFVNNCATTLQALRDVGDRLVDLHGPYDHQSLLSVDFQLDLLDAYGHLEKPRTAYAEVYHAIRALEREREALAGDDESVAREIDVLEYQVEEIEAAELVADEEDELENEHATAANAQSILEHIGAARNALTEDDAAAFNAVVQAGRSLRELASLIREGEAWREEVESIATQVNELAGSLADFAYSLETDPKRLQWLDDRLTLVRKLAGKYGGSAAAALAYLESGRHRLEDLKSRGEQVAALEVELARRQADLQAAGEDLRERRAKAAKKLAKAITAELGDLGFANGRLDIGLGAAAPRLSGIDAVEFTFSPNKGEPARPLRAIASSGEISRVMLATKAVLAAHDRIPVLIFDEIDANVGGEIGHAIGVKLAAVAAHRQVLAITHLPQVAAHGGAHYAVAKEVKAGRTTTQVERLEGEARVEEMARMLGGKERTSVTVRHARELLDAV